MNFPDNFNTAAFNSIFGSRESDADETYDLATAQVQDAINRAFDDEPADNPMASNLRLMAISEALAKATKRLEKHVTLSASDAQKAKEEMEMAKDYNIECDKAAVSQNIAAMLYVYRQALDRAGA